MWIYCVHHKGVSEVVVALTGRTKKRRKAMTKKTSLIALGILFILPTLCLAQDVKVGEIRMKWRGIPGGYSTLLVRIPIENKTAHGLILTGSLILCDQDGFEVARVRIQEEFDPEESKTVQVPYTKETLGDMMISILEIELKAYAPPLEKYKKPIFKMRRSFPLPPQERREPRPLPPLVRWGTG